MSAQTKWMLVYARNLTVPPGGSTGGNETAEFRSFLGLVLFVIRNRAARAAVRAGRIKIIEVTS